LLGVGKGEGWGGWENEIVCRLGTKPQTNKSTMVVKGLRKTVEVNSANAPEQKKRVTEVGPTAGSATRVRGSSAKKRMEGDTDIETAQVNFLKSGRK